MPFGAHAFFTIVRLLEAELATWFRAEKWSLDIFVYRAESKALYVN